MKTLKTIGLVALMMVVTNFAMANKGSVAAAKQTLHETISKTVQNDLPRVGNYLYENQIYSLNDDVKLIFAIGQNQQLEVIRVISSNSEAAGYVKDLFNKEKVKADPVLTGKSFTVNIHVKFKAN